ncbi:hypothetical protein AVEN_155695-1 [Araneus ventricosus]|uniref:Uncharacterized protein n=1 Tax=Araneus ventricosus TaxID=182803 RepID=A0A4Y2W6J1_ARAVE|nr:hypothetical protein AVEN_64660-1 [Araneus ventricosus]GBO31754.1 hypothetical protein AVEN_155695-1 [Araneus ventricosus]
MKFRRDPNSVTTFYYHHLRFQLKVSLAQWKVAGLVSKRSRDQSSLISDTFREETYSRQEDRYPAGFYVTFFDREYSESLSIFPTGKRVFRSQTLVVGLNVEIPFLYLKVECPNELLSSARWDVEG